MKIETLKDRIQKAEETISKKKNTVSKKIKTISNKEAKIRKLGFEPAEAMELGWSSDQKENEASWLAVDIKNLEEDIERLHKEIAETEKRLAGYQEELQVVIDKENNRNIQVIIDFLENWKTESNKFYHESLPKYLEARDRWKKEDKELHDKRWHGNLDREGKRKVMEEQRRNSEMFTQAWGWIIPFVYADNIREEELTKALNEEADRKYDFIVEKTTSLVGQITDATHLYIANNGNLNGFIIGTTGKINVQTISAGGWNIQRFHFRTLIHKV